MCSEYLAWLDVLTPPFATAPTAWLGASSRWWLRTTCDALLVVYACCCYDILQLFWVITLMYADTTEEVELNSVVYKKIMH